MHPGSDYYRRRGFDAQQRSTQAYSEEIRNVFEEAAESWFELANVCDSLDRLEDRLEADLSAGKKKRSEDFRWLADQCRKAACRVSTQEERAELLERAKTWDFLAEHPPPESWELNE
jgi:hypothetical protein